MTASSIDGESIVFFNGQLVAERDAGIPIRDRGFIYGDAVFDATRTFNGRPSGCGSTSIAFTTPCGTCA